MLRLSAITDRADLKEKAGKTIRLFAERLQRMPQAAPHLLLALDFWLHEPKRVVIAGNPKSPEIEALLRAAHSVYQPNKVVLNNSGPVEPFARTLPLVDNKPAVYLCTGAACQKPTADLSQIKQLLKN